MRIALLDGFPIDQAELDWNAVARHGDLAVYPRTLPSEVLARASEAEAVLVNKVLLSADVIAALPRLRYIGILATGTNVVDFAACRARGIAVTNVPGYAAPSVAQFVMAMLLHVMEDVPGYAAAVRSNAWSNQPDYCFFLRPRFELAEKTMAILGMGAIGARVADLAKAFGMHVLAAQVPGGSSEGRVPLGEALARADVVSLHCPLTDRTRRMVDANFLGNMKRGAVLINTSRGALIDEAALTAALSSGHLGSALLDVVEQEPPPRDYPLFDPAAPWASRLIVTPHASWGTVEARRRLIDTVGRNLGAFLEGKRLNRVD